MTAGAHRRHQASTFSSKGKSQKGGLVRTRSNLIRARRSSIAKAVASLTVVLAWTLAVVQPAAADTIQFTGQGTNADGTCGEFEGAPPQPGGTQTWQFNLTGTQPGATMSASFSDGTSVSNLAESDHNGNTSMWFITTSAGASLNSASATFTPAGPGNPQFVVSHCTAGGTPPTTAPPTSAPPTTAPPRTAPPVPSAPAVPGAAAAVPAQPRTTG
jgi:chitinase